MSLRRRMCVVATLVAGVTPAIAFAGPRAGLAPCEGAESGPAALVRGVDLEAEARAASARVRPPEEDLFRGPAVTLC